jgi:hypothetical protein
LIVRILTHEFAHVETLERARRWLIQAGFDPARIEVHTHGTPRIVVAVGPGEGAEVEMVLRAVEAGDPDGSPSFWDLARQQHVYPQPEPTADQVARVPHSTTFVIGWRPVDSQLEVTQLSTDVAREVAFLQQWVQQWD